MLCRDCPYRANCFPAPLNARELAVFESHVEQFKLPAGERAVSPGDPFSGYFAVRSGVLKVSAYTGSGEERVLRFHFGGEISGFAEAAHRAWLGAMIGIEDALLCRVPPSALRTPRLKDRLATLTAERLLRNYEFQVATKRGNRAQRLAAFLIQISARQPEQAGQRGAIRLPMGQRDVANYLGLTKESVNRAFAELKAAGRIEQRGRYVQILDKDMKGLQAFIDEAEE